MLISILAVISVMPCLCYYLIRLASIYNKLDKYEKPCYLFSMLGAYIASFIYGYLIYDNIEEDEIIGIVFITLLIGVGFLILANRISKIVLKQKEKQQEKANQDKALEEKIALQKLVEQNKWIFPYKEFYTLCVESQIKPGNSDFNRQKLQNAVKFILDKYNIPDEFHAKYLSNGKDYYLKGKKEASDETNKIQKEKFKHDSTPIDYTPSAEEQEIISAINSIKNLYGIEKRQVMLQNEIDFLSAKCSEIINKIPGSNSVTFPYRKEKSWATWGGLANAIAGPGAGVMTALQVQKDNENIRAQNAMFVEANLQLQAMKKKVSEQLHKEYDILAKEESVLKKEKDRLPLKVVLSSPNTSKILKHMNLRNWFFNKTESGILQISVTASCIIPSELLPDPNLVVDGTLNVNLYYSDKFISSIYLVLPREGLSANGHPVVLNGISTTALPIEAKYSPQVGDNSNLWIMEK